MKITPEIEMLPVMHGREFFAREVRRLCYERKFDCIAVDIPALFQDDLGAAVDGLPLVSALLAYNAFNKDDYMWYYVPTDPCDAMIEGVRQARQRRIPFVCVGKPRLYDRTPLIDLPDPYSVTKTGFDAYAALCRAAVAKVPLSRRELADAKHIGGELDELRVKYGSILAITRIRLFDAIKNYVNPDEFNVDRKRARGSGYTVVTRFVNPDHLYFALGELPFITGKIQRERHDPFAAPVELTDAVKDLFTETRDNYFEDKEQALRLSPVRIQTALTYLRNLTVMSGRLIPDLFDIVEAAKGVGGNAYALRILKSAKYYPFLPIECGGETVNMGIDKISLAVDAAPDAEREVYMAENLFRDTETYWRNIDIRPDPSEARKKKYRYSWNPFGHCSHLPEDERIENFNAHARGKAMRVATEHLARTEKFTSSVKDGIDIRETLRNWHTGSIYVKELPPARNKLDTVIVIFDDRDDNRYPQRATWYAEHDHESTLSFYATDIFDNMIGPGIARCTYGGVAMLFPPRTVPDLFEVTGKMSAGAAEQLVAGSLFYSKEKIVAYIAPSPPPLRLRALERQFKKHLVWIPMSTFSTETLSRLRHFHVLNGKEVRSWAARFIGDER